MNRLAVLEKPKISHRVGSMIATPLVPKTKKLEHPFVKELMRQFRLLDRANIYSYYSSDSLLESWLVTDKKSSLKSLEIDQLTRLRVSAFYHAIATIIERETGQITQVFINLSSQSISSALICCGNLLVINELLPKASSFGFDSVEKLVDEADKLIQSAMTRIEKFF
jgi:probable nitrogen fixation protein